MVRGPGAILTEARQPGVAVIKSPPAALDGGLVARSLSAHTLPSEEI